MKKGNNFGAAGVLDFVQALAVNQGLENLNLDNTFCRDLNDLPWLEKIENLLSQNYSLTDLSYFGDVRECGLFMF